MRRYEVRVHLGQATPELHWIMAASDEAASERAERLMVDSPGAVGIEVICDGERLHVRGVAPVATATFGRSQRLDPEQPSRLWALMQRVERARHRAELSEAKTANCSAAFRTEMAEVAQAWRDLARHIEAEDAAPDLGLALAGEDAAASATVSQAPSGPVGGLRRWSGLVVGVVIGALGALTLATPRWIEASTGVDLDRGSGALEWTVAGIGPLALIAVLAVRASPRRAPAKIRRRRSSLAHRAALVSKARR